MLAISGYSFTRYPPVLLCSGSQAYRVMSRVWMYWIAEYDRTRSFVSQIL